MTIDSHAVQTLFMVAAVLLALGAYVVLDGFDLGIGILSAFAGGPDERDQMMNAIGPFWDGNETWLVFGGAVLLAMFPYAFSVILPALYLPLIVMLLALVFRGVAFEFRSCRNAGLKVWNLAFSVGSTLAAFAQGVALGTFVQGIKVVDGRFAGGPLDWLDAFSLMTGAALVVGYGLLGAGFLFWRVNGPLQARAGRWARPLLYGLVAFIAVVSVWTPLQLPGVTARWFNFPLGLIFLPVPVLTVLCAFQARRKLSDGRRSAWPFACSVGLFFLSFTGLAISIFPMLPPPSVSLFDAAASSSAQRFLLPGIVLFIPVILLRTWFNYRLFALHSDGELEYPKP